MNGVPQFVNEHLIWSSLGSCWGVWSVEASDYLYATHRRKFDIRDQTRAALLAVDTEALVMNICEPLSAEAVGRAMSLGVPDLRTSVWSDHVETTQSALAGVPMYRRRTFLAVALATESVSQSIRAGLSSFSSLFGAAPALVPDREVERAREQASRLESALRLNLGRVGTDEGLRRATEAEVLWLFDRVAHRGILEKPSTSEQQRALDASARRVRINGGLLIEAGTSADRRGRSPLARKFLRVDTDEGTAYQCMMALSVMPTHFTFPGSEWLLGVERVPFPVDWALRVRVRSNQEARRKINRKKTELGFQEGEYGTDGSGDAPASLSWALEDLEHQQAELEANPSQPEYEVSTYFATWSDSLETLDQQVNQLKNVFDAQRFPLHAPIGGQRGLYEAMVPGTRAPSWPNDFQQILMVDALAAGQPFTGVDVGDPRGLLLGENLNSGTVRPVLFDPAYGPSGEGPNGARSGSIGILGDLGSGKSYLAKKLCHGTVARGGQVVVFDRTPVGEWVRFGRALPGHPQTISVGEESTVSLDPLRVFGGDDGMSVAIATLGLLARVGPTEPEGVAIAEAVRSVASGVDASMKGVLERLELTGATDEAAQQVIRRLRTFAHEPLARMLFGDGSPLRLSDADYIVFHAPDLDLPAPEEWQHEHLARLLQPRKIVSQALLFLVAATARQISFSNTARFSAVVLEEAWAVLANTQGARVAQELIKDGRKHNAALWLVSQSPADFPSESLAAHLGSRFLFRQSDRTAARKSLELFGIDATDDTVDLLTSSLGEGQCLFRDIAGRTGLVQVLKSVDELHDAALTDQRKVS